MLRRLAPVVLAALVAAPFLATAARAEISLGLKGGICVSQITSDVLDPKWRTGAGGGVSLAIGLLPQLEFAPELLYVRKGAELFATDITIGGITFGDIRTNFDLDYVELPLLLRFNLLPTSRARLMLEGGPVVALKTAEKLTTSGLASLSLSSDEIKSNDYGLMLGGGVGLPLGTARLTLEGRYTFGLADVNDLPFGGELKNSDALILAGLEFPLTK